MAVKIKADRYDTMEYRRCGHSGLKLPVISLGCWHNFGARGTGSAGNITEKAFNDNAKKMIYTAFNCGITHIDLANGYGPPAGAAEKRVGKIIRDLPREELVISTKAGYRVWPGPYGDGGSRKYLLSSVDMSLKRMGLDYIDIFYHHRPDPETPLEETLEALNQAITSGKALYAGVSNYSAAGLTRAQKICAKNGWHRILIHQPAYNMLLRKYELDLFGACERTGTGIICYCPLEQGLLTGKYLKSIPKDSRAVSKDGFLQKDRITPELVKRLNKLNDIATKRGQSLAQMALAWVLRRSEVTSVLIGASRPAQITENVKVIENLEFSKQELAAIDKLAPPPKIK